MTEQEQELLKPLINRAKQYFPRELVENATDFQFIECILSSVIVKGEEINSRKEKKKERIINICIFIVFFVLGSIVNIAIEILRGI